MVLINLGEGFEENDNSMSWVENIENWDVIMRIYKSLRHNLEQR